ncbi:hypothetical protein [Kingella potus]|uniref:hypothetical protein n=1 Tax=Kingella potus TaxID=265175 RepID=UPI0011C0276C|nr:hypothetical protein [Kingella potus]UOO99891.1 hypothetical protein LVJ84_07380 [Kingella potus]
MPTPKRTTTTITTIKRVASVQEMTRGRLKMFFRRPLVCLAENARMGWVLPHIVYPHPFICPLPL